jgi:hypothetical protein
MAKTKLSRVDDATDLTAQDVYSKLVNNHDFSVTPVKVQDKFIDFQLDAEVRRDLLGRTAFSADDETKLAVALHKALVPARRPGMALLRDPGVWAWIGLYELRNYVLIRWCGATPANMLPSTPERCSYFLTGDALVRQARCAVRRLWIAADASHRARSDYSAVAANLALTDLYTGVFERMLGLDAELACLLTHELHRPVYSEEDRRKVLIGVGVRLSTIALECLDADQKSQLVSEVIQDLNSNPNVLS